MSVDRAQSGMILAVHQLQYSVATALHGQVDMLAHVRLLGNHPQRLVAHVLGMTGGEADAHVGSLVGNEAKQFWKKYLSTLLSPLSSIRIYILPQQRYFLETTVAQVAHFAQDALHIATALTTTGIGHDAVVAEVIAATHDADKSANLVAEGHALRHHVAIGLSGRQFDVDGLMSRFCLSDKIRQRQIGIGTCHQVDTMLAEQVVLHPFGHATQHADNESLSRMCQIVTADGVECFQTAIDFLLGIVTHRACVQELGICLVQAIRRLIASHLHHGSHHLRVSHVHLASVCLDIQFLHNRLQR